uniref:Uncharacterized protein n=1 Tax=viral metagenome TaxID=1070528 RepID=A0A6H1Z8A2_9ZZZZ
MELSLPSSLTAIVHMKFRYDEKERKLVGEAEIQLLDELLGRAGELDPELQELLVKFADYVSKSSTKSG